MPMFYTPKPRQFHYKPRFYDPEKEEWEKLKTKYRLEKGLPLDDERFAASHDDVSSSADNNNVDGATDDDMEYFRRKVRSIDREERAKRQHLTLNDMFRKREKPQFHYVSRFDSEGNLKDPAAIASEEGVKKRKITRRFDNDDDWDRFKPIPAGKIITYTLAAILLLMFIFL